MNKIFKYLLITIGVFLLIGALSSLYLYYMPDKNLASSTADFTVKANALFNEYDQNQTAGDQKYMDRIIEVAGRIAEISKDQKGATVILLRSQEAISGVLCTLKEGEQVNKKVGDKIKMRGICTGMLMDVVLNKCVVMN